MIHRDLPFADYVALPGVNQSSFSDIDPDRDGCPSIWNARHGDHAEREDTDSAAKSFGRAFHSYALTPEVFDAEYRVETDKLRASILVDAAEEIAKARAAVDAKKSDGWKIKDIDPKLVAASRRKAPTKFSRQLGAWTRYTAQLEADGVSLLTEDEFGAIESMWASALSIPLVTALHADPEATELSVVAELDDGTGRMTLCKARFDLLSKSGEIHDIKTVQSAAPAAIGKFIWKYRAYIQAAFYLDLAKAAGIQADRFSWVFIDKRPPYPAVYHVAERELIKLGRVGYQSFLQVINDCRARSYWPGHHDSPIYPSLLETMMEEMA